MFLSTTHTHEPELFPQFLSEENVKKGGEKWGRKEGREKIMLALINRSAAAAATSKTSTGSL